ncbi:MAG: hypothetical protein KF883_04420 [Thermomicrobiales bacterium]|jgi:hypothetical protein|nr:hypothetical protein [Thermomicrobiales bacterium]
MARSGKSTAQTQDQSPALPFLMGAVVGGLAGALVGAMLGRHSGEAVSSLVNVVDKKANRNRKDRPRFDLLLQ